MYFGKCLNPPVMVYVFAGCYVFPVLLLSVLLLPLPLHPVFFFLLGVSILLLPGLTRHSAQHLQAINPLDIPSLDFSSVPEYPGCSLIAHVYSCNFLFSCEPFFLLVVFDCGYSLFLFRLCGLPQSASPLVLPVIFDSGLFVVPHFLFSSSVVTLLVF